MDLVQRIAMKRAKDKKWLKKIEEFAPGDTLKVFVRIKEGEKERVQLFKGVVVKIQGSGLGKTFTVRKISSGVGVERTFPFSSPKLEKVEVVSRGQVRRSRLYYLRDLSGRAARLDSELVVAEGSNESVETAGVEMNPNLDKADAAEGAEKKEAAPKKEAKKSKE